MRKASSGFIELHSKPREALYSTRSTLRKPTTGESRLMGWTSPTMASTSLMKVMSHLPWVLNIIRWVCDLTLRTVGWILLEPKSVPQSLQDR